jgi:hypothetical protein
MGQAAAAHLPARSSMAQVPNPVVSYLSGRRLPTLVLAVNIQLSKRSCAASRKTLLACRTLHAVPCLAHRPSAGSTALPPHCPAASLPCPPALPSCPAALLGPTARPHCPALLPCPIARPHCPTPATARPDCPAPLPCPIALPHCPARLPCPTALPHCPAHLPCPPALPHCPA